MVAGKELVVPDKLVQMWTRTDWLYTEFVISPIWVI